MLDKDGSSTPLFNYEIYAKQLRLQSGSKRLNILDKRYQILGQVLFDFETVNLVSKEESVKNIDKEKKAENEVTVINI